MARAAASPWDDQPPPSSSWSMLDRARDRAREALLSQGPTSCNPQGSLWSPKLMNFWRRKKQFWSERGRGDNWFISKSCCKWYKWQFETIQKIHPYWNAEPSLTIASNTQMWPKVLFCFVFVNWSQTPVGPMEVSLLETEEWKRVQILWTFEQFYILSSKYFFGTFQLRTIHRCWRVCLWVRRSRYPEGGETSEIRPGLATSQVPCDWQAWNWVWEQDPWSDSGQLKGDDKWIAEFF